MKLWIAVGLATALVGSEVAFSSEAPLNPGRSSVPSNRGASAPDAPRAKQIRVRQVRIFAPNRAPYANEFWGETILGQIIKPAVADCPDLAWFWFSRYYCTAKQDGGDCDISKVPQDYTVPGAAYRSVKFRYSVTEDALEEFERACAALIQKSGCFATDFRDYDYLGDLGAPRFLGGEWTPQRRRVRADLVAAQFCATCRLVLDTLAGPAADGKFTVEKDLVSKENPVANSPLESIHHIFCNSTAVPLVVLTSNPDADLGTHWGPPRRQPVTAHPVRF
jgi:hypothetical protein